MDEIQRIVTDTIQHCSSTTNQEEDQSFFTIVPEEESHHAHINTSFSDLFRNSPLSPLTPSASFSPIASPPRDNFSQPSSSQLPLQPQHLFTSNQSLSNMTAPQPQQFPLRGSSKAPHWTWKGPEDNFTLSIFFDEVERTCRSIGKADDKDFIDAAILYTDPSARELWGRLPETRAATPDWTVFKTQCYSYYPKANKTDRYTSAHLRQVAEYLQKIPIQTLDDFGRYDRHIMTIGLDLLQRTTPLIHKAELNYFYSRGIHPALQMHIIQRLSLMHPNHQPGEPFDYELVQAAAKYILESQLSPYGNLPMMYPPQMYQYESPQMGIPASYPTWQMPAPAMPLQMYTDPTPQVHHAPPQPKLSMEEVIKGTHRHGLWSICESIPDS